MEELSDDLGQVGRVQDVIFVLLIVVLVEHVSEKIVSFATLGFGRELGIVGSLQLHLGQILEYPFDHVNVQAVGQINVID